MINRPKTTNHTKSATTHYHLQSGRLYTEVIHEDHTLIQQMEVKGYSRANHDNKVFQKQTESNSNKVDEVRRKFITRSKQISSLKMWAERTAKIMINRQNGKKTQKRQISQDSKSINEQTILSKSIFQPNSEVNKSYTKRRKSNTDAKKSYTKSIKSNIEANKSQTKSIKSNTEADRSSKVYSFPKQKQIRTFAHQNLNEQIYSSFEDFFQRLNQKYSKHRFLPQNRLKRADKTEKTSKAEKRLKIIQFNPTNFHQFKQYTKQNNQMKSLKQVLFLFEQSNIEQINVQAQQKKTKQLSQQEQIQSKRSLSKALICKTYYPQMISRLNQNCSEKSVTKFSSFLSTRKSVTSDRKGWSKKNVNLVQNNKTKQDKERGHIKMKSESGKQDILEPWKSDDNNQQVIF